LLWQAAEPSGSGFGHVRNFTYLSAANQDKQNHQWHGKGKQKSEIITAFGGIFFVLDRFDRILSSVIDSHLGLRSKLIGYQYSEIIRAVFSVFCCGGDCMEDLNIYSEKPYDLIWAYG